MGVVSNSHVFSSITLSTYIRPYKHNVKYINVRKAPENVFGLVIIKIPKNAIISLWTLYYISQNPENTISQTALKHYK